MYVSITCFKLTGPPVHVPLTAAVVAAHTAGSETGCGYAPRRLGGESGWK